MLVALASHSRQDEQTIHIETGNENKFEFIYIYVCFSDENKIYLSVEESILNHVLRLLKKEMPDNVKMLTQYFQFFVNYSSIGRHEVSSIEFSSE
jgi:hypothetical protein